MQEEMDEFKQHFDTDKKLQYRERVTEIDAFLFAREKIQQYLGDLILDHVFGNLKLHLHNYFAFLIILLYLIRIIFVR